MPHASCNSCNYRNEDPVHYFLECPTYQLARTNLLRSVDPIITDIFQDINKLVNRRSKERLIQTRQSEMANTSPATCQCLATFIPLKSKMLIFFRDVISLLARVIILLIDTATQEVPMNNI